ncbi:hypothetical protein [Actinomadura mexicana]|uniref:SdpI/YhfL protein family protein n=1 Tax=Actinomadura mexicana TaxID=134959 RepID=A0A239BZH5_9ACTN|nr:hypothetical protein [Actinomadura mexicana]SNS13069.1 hypothetical protein SAMN06265355_111185 [Actinomadura mexicana]
MKHQEFYTTLAQVYPVLLLALLWDSRYLENLRVRERRHRRDDPVDGVWFWTKGRVRAYTIVLTVLILGGLGTVVLGLAGLFEDSVVLRTSLGGTFVLTLVTLLVRVWGQVVVATRS